MYSDHEYCFGCQHYRSYGVNRTKTTKNVNRADTFSSFSFTDDHFPEKVTSWLLKYQIVPAEWKHYGLLWEPYKEWLGFPFYENEKLVAANFRNFGKEGRKYYTFGKRTHFHVWGNPDSNVILFVEDCLSAIKVGRSFATYPLLGAHVPVEALKRASSRFDLLGVWLDSDKALTASKAVLRASVSLPGRMFRVASDLDPKEYPDDVILDKVYRSSADVRLRN